MVLQTKDIIKILPFDEKFKKELLESFDKLDVDRKNNIERLLWATYDALYNLKLQENLRIAFDEAGRNQEKLDKNFYSRVKKLTDDEMSQVGVQDIQAMDLDITREKLAGIVADKSS